MQYDENSYEETIDLRMLVADALHKWKWMVMAAVIGVLLFAGYRMLVPAKPSIDETAIAELQTAINNNQAALTANTTDLQGKQSTIAADNEKIPATQELLVSYNDSMATLQQNLDTLKAALQTAQTTLSDPGLTAAESASVIVQLPTLTNDIASVDGQIRSVAEKINNANRDIATFQKEIEDLTVNCENISNTIASLQTQLTQQQEQLATLQEGTISRIKTVPGSAILGGILGILVFCFVVFIQFLMDKRLRSAEELEERYRLPILGEFYSDGYKKHSKFDQMLDRWTGDSQTLPEEQGVYKLAAASIISSMPEGGRIAVTGTVAEELAEKVCSEMKPLLPEEYKLQALSNPVYNAEFLSRIKDYTVLLVEAKGSSNKKELDKLAELLIRNQVPVLGAVVR